MGVGVWVSIFVCVWERKGGRGREEGDGELTGNWNGPPGEKITKSNDLGSLVPHLGKRNRGRPPAQTCPLPQLSRPGCEKEIKGTRHPRELYFLHLSLYAANVSWVLSPGLAIACLQYLLWIPLLFLSVIIDTPVCLYGHKLSQLFNEGIRFSNLKVSFTGVMYSLTILYSFIFPFKTYTYFFLTLQLPSWLFQCRPPMDEMEYSKKKKFESIESISVSMWPLIDSYILSHRGSCIFFLSKWDMMLIHWDFSVMTSWSDESGRGWPTLR